MLAALRRDAPPGAAVLAATRGSPEEGQRVLDIDWPESWEAALEGVTGLFMIIPPRISRGAGLKPGQRARRSAVSRVLLPFVAAARRTGVRHVVFLSVQGADTRRAIPHALVEKGIMAADGVDWTLVRCSYFMQNLCRSHLREMVREQRAIELPAGRAELNWADARDAGEMAAHALLHPAESAGCAWEVASDRAGYARIAELLTGVLEERVVYRSINPFKYAYRMATRGRHWGYGVFQAALHLLPRLGRPPALSRDFERVMGRSPVMLGAFLREHRSRWIVGVAAAGGPDDGAGE